MTSPLENLSGPGQPLRKEAADTKEFTGLHQSGLKRHTLNLGPEVWRVLARCHDLRNRGEYEGDLYVDERLVSDLVNACKIVAAAVHQLPRVT